MLQISTADAIRTLTLARPEAGNALNAALIDALERAVVDTGTDAAIRALVISGDGSRFFCAGGDVTEFSEIRDEPALFRMLARMERLLRSIGDLRMPVIAAVNGYALGAGAELAMACDLRVFGSEARIGFTQVSIGVLPTSYTLDRLRAMFGQGAAIDLILTGATLTAAEATTRGLGSGVVAAGTEVQAARERARELTANCPLAMGAAKALLAAATPFSSLADAETKHFYPQLWFSPFHRDAERRFAARHSSKERHGR